LFVHWDELDVKLLFADFEALLDGNIDLGGGVLKH
jgi:hypothetical protein